MEYALSCNAGVEPLDQPRMAHCLAPCPGLVSCSISDVEVQHEQFTQEQPFTDRLSIGSAALWFTGWLGFQSPIGPLQSSLVSPSESILMRHTHTHGFPAHSEKEKAPRIGLHPLSGSGWARGCAPVHRRASTFPNFDLGSWKWESRKGLSELPRSAAHVRCYGEGKRKFWKGHACLWRQEADSRGSTYTLSLPTKHEASKREELQTMNGNRQNLIQLRPHLSSIGIKLRMHQLSLRAARVILSCSSSKPRSWQQGLCCHRARCLNEELALPAHVSKTARQHEQYIGACAHGAACAHTQQGLPCVQGHTALVP